MKSRFPHLAAFLWLGAGLLACGGGGGGDDPTPAPPPVDNPAPPILPEPPPPRSELDNSLRALIEEHGLTGDPVGDRRLPSISDPLAQLGRDLFFSRALGGDTDSACVSCHHPILGGGDNLSLPIGVGAENPSLLGGGRRHSEVAAHFDGGPTIARNAPTTFNSGLWRRVLLHDGVVEKLPGGGLSTPDSPAFGQPDPNAGEDMVVAQAGLPVATRLEMQGFSFAIEENPNNARVRAAIAARLAEQRLPNNWLPRFQEAFDSQAGAADLITFPRIAEALGAYQRSQVFVNTPWRAYVQGDEAALETSAKRGALLFFREPEQGGAGCAQCHGGDFFTDESFHVLAMPQLGRGKGDGPHGDDDFGRFRLSKQARDRHAFRTPSLLNVEVTGPYGHAGAYPNLEGVVRHHLNVAQAVDRYDYRAAGLQPGIQTEHAEANTRAALADLQANREAGESTVRDVELDDGQIADLLAFLRALTDPCVKDRACLAPWIPPRDQAGPDHLRLNGVNRDGMPL